MHALFERGKYILLGIFLDWIKIDALTHFDSALCNHELRSLYIFDLSITSSAFNGPEDYFYDIVFLNWIKQRGVHIKNLTCNNNVLRTLLNEKESGSSEMLLCLHHVKSMKIMASFANHINIACELMKSIYSLECLEIKDGAAMTDYFLDLIADNCTTLKTFILGSSKITSLSLNKLIKRNTSLEFIDLSNAVFAVTDSDIIALSLSCTLITSLNLSNQSELHDDTLMRLTCCEALTSLNLHNFQQLTSSTIMAIILSCTAIINLDVGGCTLILDDNFLYFLSSTRQTLVSLNVRNSVVSRFVISATSITDKGISALCTGCTLLEILDISQIKLITLDAVKLIVMKLVKLRKITFARLMQLDQSKLLSILSSSFDEVHSIDLVNNVLEGLPRPRESIMELISTRLSLLLLDKGPNNHHRFEQTTFRLMFSRDCINLRAIELFKLRFAPTFVEMFLLLPFPQLKSLHLRECRDDSLNIIAVYCSNLTSVTLSRCHTITDSSVCAIIQGNRRSLIAFSCTRCSLVSDVTVFYLSDVCSKTLQVFHMLYCDTEFSSVLPFVEKCKLLTSIDYSYNGLCKVENRYDLIHQIPNNLLHVKFCHFGEFFNHRKF
jgi:hypothetical protein